MGLLCLMVIYHALMAETTTQLFETTNPEILSKLQSAVESVPLGKDISDPISKKPQTGG